MGELMKPVALDLYCGAGIVCAGLQRAGFDVYGVDISPQPHYPGTGFLQADVLSLPKSFIDRFDFIWASPPCQAYSAATSANRAGGTEYPDLVAPTRELIQHHPTHCIENVPGAPITVDLKLECGKHFGLWQMKRQRNFELSFLCREPRIQKGTYDITVGPIGDIPPSGLRKRRRERGLPTRETLLEMEIAFGAWHLRDATVKAARYGYAQGVPSWYSEHIGRAAISHIEKWNNWRNQ